MKNALIFGAVVCVALLLVMTVTPLVIAEGGGEDCVSDAGPCGECTRCAKNYEDPNECMNECTSCQNCENEHPGQGWKRCNRECGIIQ